MIETMSLDYLLSHLPGLPVQIGLFAAAAVTFFLLFGVKRPGKIRLEAPPKPRPVSIETELAMDVKGRWKNQYRRSN